MGEFLWTFAVEEMLKKVLKVAGEQIDLVWGFEEHLSKLQKWLLKSEAFLRDINTRKLHHDSVRMWVDDLRHLVYIADDLLDEIVYEDLRQKVQTRKMKKVCDFFSPSSNSFIFRRNMAKKMMTLIELLEKHYHEAAPLGLVGNEIANPEIDIISQFRETISEIEDHKIVGRDVEVESIVKQVIDGSNQLTSVLPIVGMGGLGKTTLAKLVFNHELVREHFDKTVWVCVSEPFIVNKILLDILQNLKGSISSGGNSKEVLLRELQKEMLGRRYFLVLDDVWNENAFLWDELKYCLLTITGNSKNSIVVTTRSAEVAKTMGTCPSHHLSRLSDDQCWSLFKESANAYGLSMTLNLGIIQKELVKKIGGVPLAARVLGRAIKFEGDVKRWEEMLKSVLITPLQEENFVLSILKLSVDRLPSSSLKQCFAYCSIFPKNFEFKKQDLIQMWMAQGFLQPQEGRNVTMENLGDIYFKILFSHCLFQDPFEIKADFNVGGSTYFKMHDLVHDIAMKISRDQNLNHSNMLEKKLQKKESKNVACKLRMIDFIQKIPHNIDQTLFDVTIRNFVCLRVLKISIDMLPKSIGQLKHLRYLKILNYRMGKLSKSILSLPKSIFSLHNLQTLKIKNSKIEEFPMNFTNLVSLRHLKLVKANKTPPHLSQLTQLQTLSHFEVGIEKGCMITELGPLKNLEGRLSLLCLEKVGSKEEANGADLAGKENLKELLLTWSVERKDNNSYNDLEVLEGLQPNQNLQLLRIDDFAGSHLPNRIFVENLRMILLSRCNNCEKLPMLGQLNNLKDLEIKSLHGVQIIDTEFYGNDPNQRRFFPKLEKFVMCDMINLEQWEEVITNDASSNVTIFPNLKWLEICDCPKLLNIPEVFDENDIQHLESLIVSRCNKLTKLSNGLHFCNSTRLVKIVECSNLIINMRHKSELCHLSIGPLDKLPEDLCHLVNLRRIKIVGNMQNYDFGFLQHLPSLKEVSLVEDELSNNSVTQIPQQLQYLTALEFLSIENFGGIEALPEWFGNFICLHELCLYHCGNLKKLPSTEAMLRLTKLKELYVCECPQLLLHEGDMERAKLSRLPEIQIHLNGFTSLY